MPRGPKGERRAALVTSGRQRRPARVGSKQRQLSCLDKPCESLFGAYGAPDRAKREDAINLGRWEGDALSAMNLERDTARFIYEGSRMIEVVTTCGKQRLPFNVEVVPCWLNGDRLGQKREIWIVNLTSFGIRNALSSIADVCHPKPSADRDRRGSDTRPMLANMSRCAERERTKAIVVQFERLLEIMPSNLFVSGEYVKPFLHFGMAKVYAEATLNYLGNAPRRRQERIQIRVE
jgi:hypothetical protein